jgi:putative hydrolase of the HAD superfamily
MNAFSEHIRRLSNPMEPLPTEFPIHLCPIDGMETVLFDLYGTLLISGSGDVGTAAAVNSEEALIQSLIVAGYEGDLERAGELGPTLLENTIHHWHELAKEAGTDYPEVEVSQVWKKVLEHLQALEVIRSDDDPQRILRLALEYECRVNPVWPMPEAREALDFIKERGLRIGIVSNAQFYTPLIVEELFGCSLEELGFDPDLCVFSYKQLRAKPSVELFNALASKVDFSKAVYVGNDMLNDIWTASQAGCQTILFAGDQRSLRLREKDKKCRKLVPTATVDQLMQITEMI